MLRTTIVWLCVATLALSQAPAVKKTAVPPPAKTASAASANPGPGKAAPAAAAKAIPTVAGKAAQTAPAKAIVPAGAANAAAVDSITTALPPPTQAAPTKAAAPPARQRLQKVFDVKYADVNSLTSMLNDLRRGSSPDRVIPQPGLHAIAVEAYSTAFLQSAEELIRQYDVPPMNVGQNHDFEIVAHILVAGRTPVAGEELPAALADVVKQLKDTFGYTDVKLVDSALAHSREGRDAFVKGNVSGLADGATQPSTYEMTHTLVRFEPGGKKGSIELYGFHFKMRLAYVSASQTVSVTQWQDVAFQTDLNIPEGQFVVVGKSKVGTEDKSLVLVVNARAVE